jgi:phosphoglycolate phosphatase-like HAD superfamily hydrolase
MLIFLDLDGVIIDSIEECYIVSRETYYGYAKFNFNQDEYKEQFYAYRGLVRPASHYLYLHRALESYSLNVCDDIHESFLGNISNQNSEEENNFELKFFFERHLYQEYNYTKWIKMNPLTDFGKLLVNKNNNNINILTTKNREAAESILNYYNIHVSGIYTNDEIRDAGSKGNVIENVMEKMRENRGIFIDDAVGHLKTVIDERVECYFADWGYGENDGYNVLGKSDWAKIL